MQYFSYLGPRCFRMRGPKKYRPPGRHRNFHQKKQNHFRTTKTPAPTASGWALQSDEIDSVVYCALSRLEPFSVRAVRSLSDSRLPLTLSIRRASRAASIFVLFLLPDPASPHFRVIPNSGHRLSGIRLRAFRKSFAPSSNRSSRSSMETDFLLVRTSGQDRFAARADLR